MKMTYLIVTAVTIAGLLVAFFAKENKSVPDKNITAKSLHDTTKPDENPYDGLKELAYSTRYDQLNLPKADEKEVLYGVLMDWDYEGKAIITLVSFKTGDVSLYFSTGAMLLGAGQHAEANEASKVFIEKATSLLSQANPSDTALTCEKGVLKFYLMTNKGKYTIKDKMENVYNHTSPLSSMFEEANKLITYVRLANERMQHQEINN